MANVAFFSFTESDRSTVLTIKGRAVNPNYSNLNFRVKDLLKRWDTNNVSVIRQAISKKMKGTSRTIVLVGNQTYLSRWVREEVEMTLDNDKPVFAIQLKNSIGVRPSILTENNIKVHRWSESILQDLATR